MEGQRFKTWTDGDTNTVVLGIENLKQDDEGAYKCVINNGGGEVEHEFNIYVTGNTLTKQRKIYIHFLFLLVEGGMDFRAMLMKRKKPQKKVVVVCF